MSDYLSLSSVKKVVNEKKSRFDSVKEKLISAVNNVHTIDGITNLLDYNAHLMDNSDTEFNRIKRLHEIQYESLNKKYVPIIKRRGRNKIFFENSEDIVSRFRASGIETYRTTVVEVVQNPIEESKSEIWDKVSGNWKQKMLEWINRQEGNLSHDEVAIQSVDFKVLNENPSDFSKEILESLNNDDDFKVINYHDGQVDEAVKNIITIDLSE